VVLDITYNDMITAQPFGSTFDVGEIEGKYLKEMFEFTMTPYNYGRAYVDINLLQVSGDFLIFKLFNSVLKFLIFVKVFVWFTI
jgi:hypothetical protein